MLLFVGETQNYLTKDLKDFQSEIKRFSTDKRFALKGSNFVNFLGRITVFFLDA